MFAQMYAEKMNLKESKVMTRLWGDNFYNPTTKKWNKTGGEGFVRGFNKFILEPLYKVNFVSFFFLFYSCYYGCFVLNWEVGLLGTIHAKFFNLKKN